MSAIETICVIDDDLVYQFVIKSLVKRFDHFTNVLAFINGEEALISFKNMITSGKKLPDVILLDINMPFLDGWQFMDQFIMLKPQIKTRTRVYMVSSSLDANDKKRVKNYEEVSGFMHKPLDADLLIKTLFNQH